MVTYNFVGKYSIDDQEKISDWLGFVLDQEGKELGEINYIFCDDEYLLDLNVKRLKHNTLTDIISIDYTVGTVVSGDIYISYERVRDNATHLSLMYRDELHRVMVHGILHYCGYQDKTEKDKMLMRSKEDYYLSLRTF